MQFGGIDFRISENIARVQDRILSAAKRAGCDPANIVLMAVTKTVAPEQIREAYNAGLRIFGENRVQEFAGKKNALGNLPGAQWHMIGHLQTNKAAKAAELFAAVDSVDSLRLAEKLNDSARVIEKKLPALIEINVGGETAKTGLNQDSSELEKLLQSASPFDNLEFCGLMTVPPYGNDPERARPYFRRLRELRDQIAARNLPRVSMEVLSMGMSHDFEIAVEEGATCVRIGTAIFGKRINSA